MTNNELTQLIDSKEIPEAKSEEVFIDRLARVLLLQIEMENINDQSQKIEQSEN